VFKHVSRAGGVPSIELSVCSSQIFFMYGLRTSQEQVLSTCMVGVPSVSSRRKNTAFGSSVQILTLGPEDGLSDDDGFDDGEGLTDGEGEVDGFDDGDRDGFSV